MRVNKAIDATVDEVEDAKQTVVTLLRDTAETQDTLDLFFIDDLEQVEAGIRRINEFANKSWILSAILLYTLIYNSSLYAQSGLSWAEYSKAARERLGLDQRDITEQLSAARFFIKNHKALIKAGWDATGSNRKLARAELAEKLSGSTAETIRHIVSDTFVEFKDWYTAFKPEKALPPPTEYRRADIEMGGGSFRVGGVEAVRICDGLPEQDRVRLEKYLTQIFEALRDGYEPAVVPVYSEKEARLMPILRDRYREGK